MNHAHAGLVPPGVDHALVQGLVALVVAMGSAALLLPGVMALCRRWGVVDLPGGRRAHEAPIPRLGGVAVVPAMVLAALAAWLVVPDGPFSPASSLFAPVFTAGALVFAVGLLDDVHGVAPWVKLLAQCVAALLVIDQGIVMDRVAFTHWLPEVESGGVGTLLSLLWIVGITNAFNLIDGMDGLAVLCATLAVIVVAVSGYHFGGSLSMTPVFASAALGALAAFFLRNRHPASVFLGDAGSMTLGFALAVGTLSGARDGNGSTFVLVPLAALAYPLFDTFIAIARRWLRGRPFSRADGRHIHHQLRSAGFTVPQSVRTIGAAFGLVGAGALVVAFAPRGIGQPLLLAIATLGTIAMAYALRWLGYGEFVALVTSLRSGVSTARHVVRERIRTDDVARSIAGATTELDVARALAKLADGELVLDVLLLDNRARPVGGEQPAALPIEPLRLVELTVPVALGEAAPYRLRARLSRGAVANHLTERLVLVIAPEIERWYAEHGAPVRGRESERDGAMLNDLLADLDVFPVSETVAPVRRLTPGASKAGELRA